MCLSGATLCDHIGTVVCCGAGHGFHNGLELVRSGGARVLRASPHLCYRDGELDSIPKNAVLVFDIKSSEIFA